MVPMRYFFSAIFAAMLLTSLTAQAQDVDQDGDGFTPQAGDCNDNDDEIYPNAPELCDNKDNDCDGIDDNPPDDDNDGQNECDGDCDDGNAAVFLGNTEICDAFDNDCDGDVNEGTGNRPFLRRDCYTGPANTEGVGLCQEGYQECSLSSSPFWSSSCIGEVTPVTEICDDNDNDCDGSTDEGFDVDGDGVTTCDGDCDDNDDERFPGNSEVCDGKDNDCRANTQDSNLTRSCYTGPGGTRRRGLCRDGTEACNGTTWSGTCSGQVTPVTEVCDDRDNDCDGSTDEGFDQDSDGVTSCDGDCDDNDDERFPGNTEDCDGKDNDCNAATTDSSLTRICYDGPSNTRNVGICSDGTQSCNGTTWSNACVGDVLPGTESCNALDDDCDGDIDDGFDVDNDGVTTCAGDCDDNDATNFPGNSEVCDGADNDCDGSADEDFDRDGDAFTTCGGDCNDNDASIFPGATEVCNDVDDDCDGDRDEDFTDADGDGFVFCGPNADCDDNDNTVFPGRNELCDNKDNDCDGRVDERNNRGDPLRRRNCYDGPSGTAGVGQCRTGEQLCENGSFGECRGDVLPEVESCDLQDNDCDGSTDEDFDADDDGFATCGPNADCNDSDAAIFPGAMEVCDGKNNDCDDATDERANGAPLTRACYSGPEGTSGVGQCRGGFNECLGAQGFAEVCTDEVVPEATDACDGLDNDCDGEVDETFDEDEDGFTTCGGDCDDTNAAVNPDALEICNNVDDDCDGTRDGNLTSCYTGPVGTATVGECRPGLATSSDGMPTGECIDEVLPAGEICDGLDNDCDGEVDEDFDLDADGVTSCDGDCDDNNPFVATGFAERCDCADNDCDGEIDRLGTLDVCEFGACHDFDDDSFTNCDGDCDDQNRTVRPDAPEVCGDLVDNDCDGLVDEDVDEDADGVTTCEGDCDDRFASIRPGALELCDGFDNNCDGEIDEGFDQDNDNATICEGDCDDSDRLRSPFFPEVCGDGIDNDCDGAVDPDDDLDLDGFTVCGGDCNDGNPSVYPGAPEVCDGIDNDCDRARDEGFDEDGDLFATCFGDCDDTRSDINPAAREIVDGIDNNCNDRIDEGGLDEDGDGFSFLCGDCNDDNANISPQTVDSCDGVDNDCDGSIDRFPWGDLSCEVCNDTDGDGLEDCEGDCDDTDPEVRLGGIEVCDGKDNDCNGTVDLDRITQENLCIRSDAGATVDAGRPSNDAARPDGAANASDAGVDDGGEEASGLGSAPVEVGCGCSATERRPSAAWPAVFLLFLVGLRTTWRFRRRWVPWLLALLAGCSSIEVGGTDPARDAATFDATIEADAVAAPDVGAVDTGSEFDAGRPDLGPLTTGRCRQVEDDRIRIVDFPGSEFILAAHRELEVEELGGVDAIALDAPELGLFGFAIGFPLDDAFDADDFGVGSQLIDALLDPVFSAGLPGVTGVAQRTDETLRQTFLRGTRPAARTLRQIEMVNDVLPSQVRNGLIAELARVPLPSISGLPRVEEELPTRDLVLSTLALVDEVEETATFLATVIDASKFESAASIMADLANGSHVGNGGDLVQLTCENFLAEPLFVDFIWVVDNSASMQEEQQALADAAATFFTALQESDIDFRVGVITTDGEALRGGGFTRDLAEFQDRVQVGVNGDGIEAGLEYARRAIVAARTSSASETSLREEAVPVVIFFSDEDSTNLQPPQDYIDFFAAEGVLTFAIVGPRPRGCLAVGRGVARRGESYIRVVEGVGGTSASICADNLEDPITEILVAAAGAASQTRLDQVPISGTIELQLATSTTARSRLDGFDFEPTANSILFFGDAKLQPGTPFRVSYRRFRPLDN